MTESRKFHRIRLSAKSTLSHQDVIYLGNLENFSLNGALVRLKPPIILPQGGGYILTIYIDEEDVPLRLVVEVVSAGHDLAGLKFISCDADTATRLGLLVEQLASESDPLKSDHERIRQHLAEYLR